MRTIETNSVIDSGRLLYGTDALNNVSIDGTYRLYQEGGSFDAASDVSVNSDLRVDGTLSAGAVVIELTGGGSLEVNGVLNLDSDSSVLDVSGDIDNNGTIDASGTAAGIYAEGDVDFTGGAFTKGSGLFTFDGAKAQNLLSNGQDMGDIALTGAGTRLVLAGALDADDITIGAGAHLDDSAGHDIKTGGDWNNGGTFTSGNSTVFFDGTAGQSILTGGSAAGQDLWDMAVTNSFAPVTIGADDLKILKDLDIGKGAELVMTAGDMDVKRHIIIDGEFSGANRIKVGADWRATGGVFKANESNVIFYSDEASYITGSTTFNAFTCDTEGKDLIFEAGSLQTMKGPFTITGTKGGYIGLLSTSPHSPWYISAEGARNVDHADVRDSHNISDVIYSMTSKLKRCVNWKNMKDLRKWHITQLEDQAGKELDYENRRRLYDMRFSADKWNMSMGEDMCEIINVPVRYFNWEKEEKEKKVRYLPSRMDIRMIELPGDAVRFEVIFK
jgi:cytoskeletal protein CcmA (bactofilin family)